MPPDITDLVKDHASFDGHCLEQYDNSITGGCSARMRFVDISTGLVTVEWKAMITSAPDAKFYCKLRTNADVDITHVGGDGLGFYATDIRNGAGVLISNYSLDTMYYFKYEIDFSAGTWIASAGIDPGSMTSSPSQALLGVTPTLGRIYWYSSNSSMGNCYVDDIVVTTW